MTLNELGWECTEELHQLGRAKVECWKKQEYLPCQDPGVEQMFDITTYIRFYNDNYVDVHWFYEGWPGFSSEELRAIADRLDEICSQKTNEIS